MAEQDINYAPSQIIARLLIEANVLNNPETVVNPDKDWPVAYSQMPDAPDNHVATYDTAPMRAGRILATGRSVRRHGVALRLRAARASYAAGWARLAAVDEHLESLLNRPVVFPDARFVVGSVTVDSGPMFIGFEEESRRPLFTLNLLATITRTG